MHAIRIATLLLTAWNVAVHLAKEHPPNANGDGPDLMRVKSMAQGKVLPIVLKNQQEMMARLYGKKLYESMLRNSDKNAGKTTALAFAWTPDSPSFYLADKQLRVSTTPDPKTPDQKLTEIGRTFDAIAASEVGDVDNTLDEVKNRSPKVVNYELDDVYADPLYELLYMLVIITAVSIAIAGASCGIYIIVKRCQNRAVVDYPPYGVTGPADPMGDNRLVQTAHMYHYQHQKQQITAIEGIGMDDHRLASISEPESEEEHEMGAYTVYECPGLATTGDMEVKNPMFQEPTPTKPREGKK